MLNVPGYRITDVLYQGASVWVCRGLRESGPNPVLLKLPKKEATPEDFARLRHEYQLLCKLADHGEAEPPALEESEGLLWLVSEDPGGDSLDSVLTQGPLDISTFLWMAARLVDRIQELHRHDILCKEIHPQNILVNRSTRQLTFLTHSFATLLTRENPNLINPHLLRGALSYISPEQTGRMNRSIDYRSDFYSLGAVFYKMLSGCPPFTFQDPIEAVHAHIAQKPLIPHELVPGIPQVLSSIILKLLEKNAEDRYQSGYGLLADIAECTRHLDAEGTIRPFTIASQDLSQQLNLPQKLYGRERDITTLLESFERSSHGQAELILVSGYSGIGKSALVQEIHKPLVAQHGYFISGKYEQHKQDIAYLGFVQAFQELARQLLMGSAKELSSWKEKLIDAFDGSGQILINVIPEIELIVGPQPALAPLGPSESENLFRRVFQNFVRVFTREEHPLTVFLDDLQWADSASLNLIQFLITQNNLSHLLVIGAYRDNEIMPKHPLKLSLGEIQKAGVPAQEISLTPLTLEDIGSMLRDTFGQTLSDVRTFAALLYEKTGGNPFFLKQFIRSLYENNFLSFNLERGVWQWDVQKIQARGITENVAELMAGKLRRLAPESQKAITIAACIGNQFSLDSLAAVAGLTSEQASKALWPAVLEKFVSPIGDHYKIAESPQTMQESLKSPELSVSYRFLHDKIHEAAYSLMSTDQRKMIHFDLGHAMLNDSTERETEDRIFEIVSHLNACRTLISTKSGRRRLAELNLRAGKRARSSAAYKLALENLSIGFELLSEDSWEEEYDLTLEMTRTTAECEYLAGNFEAAEVYLERVLRNAKNKIEKIGAYRWQGILQRHMAKPEKGILACYEGLKLYGIEMPDPHDQKKLDAAIKHEAAEVEERLQGRRIADLVHTPDIISPELLAVMDVLEEISIIGLFLGTSFPNLVSLKMMNLSLEHGNCGISAIAFTSYGTNLGRVHKEYDTAFLFGRAGLDLSRKYDNPKFLCKAGHWFGSYIYHWRRPVHETLPILHESFLAGLRAGDPTYASYSAFFICLHSFFSGADLAGVDSELQRYLDYFDPQSLSAMLSYQNLARTLSHRELEPGAPTMGDQFLDHLKKEEYWLALQHYLTTRMILHYIMSEFEEAWRIAHVAIAAGNIEDMIGHQIATPKHLFYRALTLAAFWEESEEGPQNQDGDWRSSFDEILVKMEKWAEACPSNFLHMALLLAAEAARHDERLHDAMRLYDQAIEAARRGKNSMEHALANELAARFFFANALDKIGGMYLQESYRSYTRWGADAKVDMLRHRYPFFLSKRNGHGEKTHSETLSPLMNTKALDLDTILKASQAISGEIVLAKLLERMLQICIENAGARRGLLILEGDEELRIQAEGTASGGTFEVLQAEPVEANKQLPASIIDYVWRTLEMVRLDHASSEGRFQTDPYIQEQRAKSVLCLASGKQTGRRAILYLENHLVEGAFTSDRVRILEILAAQASISLENSLLYDTLEQQVEARTLAFRKKNKELEEALRRLQEAQDRMVVQERLASLGALTAGIAHELKNPMNFINNFSAVSMELAQELREVSTDTKSQIPQERQTEFEELVSDLEANMSRVIAHGKRADGIIHSMLDHSRKSVGDREETDLNTLIEDNLTLAYHGMVAQNPGFEVKIERELDPSLGMVKVVPQEIGRVVLNLINNAFYAVNFKAEQLVAEDFIPTIKVSTQRRLGELKISVFDNGCGIPENIQHKIIDPFFTTKSAGEGTGLGLSISHEIIVQGYQGSFHFDSQDGKYAEFIVTLPTP